MSTAPNDSRFAASLDHVAIAVPTWEGAEVRWRELLGGGRLAAASRDGFKSAQYQYANGAKLELIAPDPTADPGKDFIRAFLDRFGAEVHHITLKVASVPDALEVLGACGIQAVGIQVHRRLFHEAFLRPRDAGGVVVQISSSRLTDVEWGERYGLVSEAPASSAASFLGVRLRHPDPAAALRVWTICGAEPTADGDGYVCDWPDSALRVWIRTGRVAGPDGLVFSGTPHLDAADGIGPAVTEAG